MLDFVTVDSIHNASYNTVNPNFTFTLSSFIFHSCDISLPRCRKGFYILILFRIQVYINIGEAMCIQDIIKAHNIVYGYRGAQKLYLRLFAVMVCICGFAGCKELLLNISSSWK